MIVYVLICASSLMPEAVMSIPISREEYLTMSHDRAARFELCGKDSDVAYVQELEE